MYESFISDLNIFSNEFSSFIDTSNRPAILHKIKQKHIGELEDDLNIEDKKENNIQEAQTEEQTDMQEQASQPDGQAQAEETNEQQLQKNGHLIAIDAGHQAKGNSEKEPVGPGSSEMKAKCTSGTQGTYSGVPEYQLNLEVSLQLKDELEQRGYQVVMTRTDNETAISNMERAQYAAEQGAEIYVRIHANGDDSHTASGALTMSPSQNNPYIPQLFEQSDRLSRCIIDSYCAATGFQNLGIQYTDTMTGINWSTVPVTILEMGFMTSQNDDLKMNDAEFQKTMVQGIANGIDSYFAS